MFDSAFLAKLERLHLLSRRTFGGQSRAERRSHKLGSSLEFADYRNYVPGDDLRSIDWNIYGRSDKLFLKLFEEEEDLHIYLLVDVSDSMRWQALDPRRDTPLRPSKLDLARRLAGTLAYIGLANLDRVNIHFFSERLGDDLGVGARQEPFSSRAEIPRPPARRSGPDRPRAQPAGVRPSDETPRAGPDPERFLRSRRVRGSAGFLLYQRFEIQLIHLLDPAELNPRLRGDLRLTDAETRQTYEVTVSDAMVRAYEREIGSFLAGLERFCQATADRLPARHDGRAVRGFRLADAAHRRLVG